MPSPATLNIDVLCIGLACFDLLSFVEHHPQADEKCRGIQVLLSGGGPAANAACTVQRLNGSSALVGYLGRDHYGAEHLQELLREGIDCSGVVRGDVPTALALIIVKPDGSRTVISHRNPAPVSALDAVNLEHYKPRVILFDGHELVLLEPLLALAKKTGAATILDAGSLRRGTLEAIGRFDYVIASQQFACDYAKTTKVADALHELSLFIPTVIVTCGAAGLVWARSGVKGRLPAIDVTAVDTTAAGDIFHGAIAFGLVLGFEWSELLHFASAAAALSCTKRGGRASIPTGAELSCFMQTLANNRPS